MCSRTSRTGSRRTGRLSGRMVARSVLRATASVALLVTAFYLLPLNRASTGAAATILAVGLVLLIILVVFQVRSIVFSPYPVLRAVEAFAISISMVLLLFASAYASMSRVSADSFHGPLTHTDALYFTITVFATVGFGDITAKTQTARLVVTGQIVLDIVIIGFVVKATTYLVTARRDNQPPASDLGPDPPS